MARPISYSQKRAAWNCSFGNSALQRLTTGADVQDLALNELCSWLLIKPTVTINVNSFVAPAIPNQQFWLTNDATRSSGLLLNVKNENGGITAANRIYTPDGGDMPIVPGHTMGFAYDLLTPAGARWRPLDPAVYNTLTTLRTVSVPLVAAGSVGYANVSLAGTPLANVTTVTPLGCNPAADAVAPGAGGGLINAWISATGTARCSFLGPLAAGSLNVLFWVPAT